MKKILIPLMSILVLTTACGSKKGGSSEVQASASELKSLEAELTDTFAVAQSTMTLKSKDCNSTQVTREYILRSDNTKGLVRYSELVSRTGDDCSSANENGIKVFEDESANMCIKSATTNGNIVNITDCDDTKYVYNRSAKTLTASMTEKDTTFTMVTNGIAADIKGLTPKLKNVKIGYFKKDGNTQLQVKSVTGNAIEILKLRL